MQPCSLAVYFFQKTPNQWARTSILIDIAHDSHPFAFASKSIVTTGLILSDTHTEHECQTAFLWWPISNIIYTWRSTIHDICSHSISKSKPKILHQYGLKRNTHETKSYLMAILGWGWSESIVTIRNVLIVTISGNSKGICYDGLWWVVEHCLRLIYWIIFNHNHIWHWNRCPENVWNYFCDIVCTIINLQKHF